MIETLGAISAIEHFEKGNDFIIGYNAQTAVHGDIFRPWADGALGKGVYFGCTPAAIGAWTLPNRPGGEFAVLAIPVSDESSNLEVSNFNALSPITNSQRRRLHKKLGSVDLVVGHTALMERVGNALAVKSFRQIKKPAVHGFYRGLEDVRIIDVLPAEVLQITR